VARGIDTSTSTLGELFTAAYRHRGTSFVEILQNCPVFNDGEWDNVTMRDVASENQLWVSHGQPLVFGKEKNRGLKLAPGGSHVDVVVIGEGGVTLADVWIHDQTNRTLAFLLSQLSPTMPGFPMAFGVLFNDPMPSYDATVTSQNADVIAKSGRGDIDKLLRSGHTWKVE